MLAIESASEPVEKMELFVEEIELRKLSAGDMNVAFRQLFGYVIEA